MLGDRVVRLVVLLVLLSAILGMCVHYAVAAPEHDRRAIGHEMIRNYGANVGETVYFWSRAVGHTDDGVRVEAAERTLEVVAATPAVEAHLDRVGPGDVVQVYGRLRPDGVVSARRIVVSEASDFPVMYAVSGVGGVLAAAFFFRYWRFDPTRIALVPRGDRDA